MTSKVEELRRIVVNAWEQHLIRDCEYALANEVHDTVNQLISASRAEGVVEGKEAGAEQERERILMPPVDKHWNSKAEELRELIKVLTRYIYDPVMRDIHWMDRIGRGGKV